MAVSKVKPKWQRDFEKKFKSVVFSSQMFPLLLALLFISVLFVLFRMKGVELNYKILDARHKLDEVKYENKSLKAQKARLLSSESLKKMANKHNLHQPTTRQIIVIPESKDE